MHEGAVLNWWCQVKPENSSGSCIMHRFRKPFDTLLYNSHKKGSTWVETVDQSYSLVSKRDMLLKVHPHVHNFSPNLLCNFANWASCQRILQILLFATTKKPRSITRGCLRVWSWWVLAKPRKASCKSDVCNSNSLNQMITWQFGIEADFVEA